MSNEDAKTRLSSHMQSFSSVVLHELLEGRTNGHGPPKIDPKCKSELIKLSSSALENESWALKITDSNGRLSSGVISGSLFHSMGDYEQCLEAGEDKQLAGGTRFCSTSIDLSPGTRHLSALIDKPEPWFKPNLGGRFAKLGLCLPRACRAEDVQSLGNSIVNSTLYPLRLDHVSCSSDLPESSLGLAITVLFFAFICMLVAVATLIDLRSRKCSAANSKRRTFIKVFSLKTSMANFRAKRLAIKPANLIAVDALKTISMLWIIAGHSYNFSLQWLQYDNLNKVSSIYKSPSAQWLANGTFAVDNFIMLSGYVEWFGHLRGRGSHHEIGARDSKRAQKVGGIFLSVLHRYLRLAPTLMALILFSINILPQLAYGPNWAEATMMFDLWCHEKWPLNLFMVHNFVATQTLCFSHSWYAAVIMQLYVVSQLVVLLTEVCRINFHWLISTLALTSQLTVAVSIYANGLPAMPLLPTKSVSSMLHYFGKVYIQPHYWLASYLIGVWAAKRLQSRVQDRNKPKPSKSFDAFLCIKPILLLLIMLALILWTWPFHASSSPMSDLHSALYAFVARPLWSFCTITLLQSDVYPARESGLFVKLISKIASCSIWTPLSRLTYPVYLIHPVIMAIFYGSRCETFQFSHQLLAYFTIGHVILSYTCSLALHLIFELPIRALTKLLLFRRSRKQHKPANSSPHLALRPR